MKPFDQLASDADINQAVMALNGNNIQTFVVATKEEAKAKVLELIPKGAEVMTNSSVTLDLIGIRDAINESGEYDAVHKKLEKMDKATQAHEMNKIGAAPAWAIGSVHAVTKKGEVLIASNTGSQLPGYAYAAEHVIWVVGTQKIVEDRDEGIKRIYEHSLPLENDRAQKAYGRGSAVNKMLIVENEIKPNRIALVFIKEVIGF